jgi:hypothetical protein
VGCHRARQETGLWTPHAAPQQGLDDEVLARRIMPVGRAAGERKARCLYTIATGWPLRLESRRGLAQIMQTACRTSPDAEASEVDAKGRSVALVRSSRKALNQLCGYGRDVKKVLDERMTTLV